MDELKMERVEERGRRGVMEVGGIVVGGGLGGK